MTVIHWYQWGHIASAVAGESNGDYFYGAFPRAPGCKELLDAQPEVWPLKYYVRTHATIDPTGKSHTKFSCGDPDSNLSCTLPALTAAWDHTSTTAHDQPTYPDSGQDFDSEWTTDYALGSSAASITVWVDEALVSGIIDGFGVGVSWDVANPSENVPVWDWSSPAISETQMPASSVVVMKALCETYNRILYGSVWEIQAAVPSDSIAEV